MPSASADDYSDADDEESERAARGKGRRWMMKAATVVDSAGRRSFKQWAQDALSGILDLLKVCVPRYCMCGWEDTSDYAHHLESRDS